MESNNKCHLLGPGKPLSGVNENTTQEQITSKYNDWAENYEHDVNSLSYATPPIAVKAMLGVAEKYGVNKDSKIIDIGAGTGFIGELLKKEGYTKIDAVDISQGMLKVAASKNCYTKLICGGIGNNSLDVPDDEYDALFCIGCISVGHINPRGISEMLNMIRPGGLYLVTVRWDVGKDEYGCKDEIDALLAHQKMTTVFKQKTDNLAATDADDHGRFCYLYCFTKN